MIVVQKLLNQNSNHISMCIPCGSLSQPVQEFELCCVHCIGFIVNAELQIIPIMCFDLFNAHIPLLINLFFVFSNTYCMVSVCVWRGVCAES